jgi:hypothetical protein
MTIKSPDTLLCFTDGNELHIAIGAIKLKPRKEIVLLARDLPRDYTKSVKGLLTQHGIRCPVTLAEVEDYLKQDGAGGTTAILVNYCTQFHEYQMLFKGIKEGVDLYFVDVTEGEVYSLKEDGDEPIPGGPVELEVDEVLEVEGFDIEESTEELMNSPVMSDMLQFVQEDIGRWDELRYLLKNNYIPNGDWIELGSRIKINYQKGSPIESFVSFLERKGYVKERVITRNQLHLRIPEAIVRSFIQTAGLWLEALTYRVIHSFSFIDDTKADVRFVWGHAPCGVVNEIDVMATADSRMIFISCKDMDNPSTGMLNELEVYAQRIGGSQGIKLLITARKPHSRHFFERAKAMGIHLIWLGHDIQAFSRVLNQVLSQELS